jgi:hypothetical protein
VESVILTNEGDPMNKGDTVVYVQILSIPDEENFPDLFEMTVERDYGDTVSVFDGHRIHLASADRVFPNMEVAIKAVTMRAVSRADSAESAARAARRVANDWLLKLKDFD